MRWYSNAEGLVNAVPQMFVEYKWAMNSLPCRLYPVVTRLPETRRGALPNEMNFLVLLSLFAAASLLNISMIPLSIK